MVYIEGDDVPNSKNTFQKTLKFAYLLILVDIINIMVNSHEQQHRKVDFSDQKILSRKSRKMRTF
jgi:hypothetical protein